jgi:hypothetical protein
MPGWWLVVTSLGFTTAGVDWRLAWICTVSQAIESVLALHTRAKHVTDGIAAAAEMQQQQGA